VLLIGRHLEPGFVTQEFQIPVEAYQKQGRVVSFRLAAYEYKRGTT
jgi:hypothetical protein